MAELTPIKAIRKHCLWCCCDSIVEVRNCLSDDCVLHPMRMGHGDKASNLTPVKAIREFCLNCVDGPAEVERCSVTDCELYPFRFGKNPKRIELGNRMASKITDEQREVLRERMLKVRQSLSKNTEE